MRVHLAPDVVRRLYELREEGHPIRAAIQLVRRNPAYPDSRLVESKPGRREIHVQVGLRGFWLQWEVRKDRGETVIEVMLTEEN